MNPIKLVLRSGLKKGMSWPVTKSLVNRIYKSRLNFDRVRQRYFAAHPMNRISIETDDVLRELFEFGLVVLPNYFDAELIRAIHSQAFDIAQRVKAGNAQPDWKALIYSDDGIYRVGDIDKVVPLARPVIEDEKLLGIARRYLGAPFRTQSNYLDFKPDIGKHDYTTVPHMDTWTSQIKIFTLLVDVDEHTAPFVYWRRSHRDMAWRRDLDYLNFTESELGSAGACPPGFVRAREGRKPEHLEEVVVTGKAGTVIIADTRGIHRASNLYHNYRLEIVQKLNPLIS
jgi:hypothetical protein